MVQPHSHDRPTTLDALRARIDEHDRDILDFCWSHYRTNGQHPKIREVYFKFEKPNVEEAVSRLTGNLIRRSWSSSTPGEDYQITHLGALASADGVRLICLLERYLQALKFLYDANHDIRGISSKDLKPYLDRTGQEFTADELQDLGCLLGLGVRILDTSAFGPNADGTWYVSIGENIEDIRRVPDFEDYLQQELVKAFDPEEPVSEIERTNRQLQQQLNQSPFWPAANAPTLDGYNSDPRGLEGTTVSDERGNRFGRLIEAMKNHPVVSFLLLMLPVAGVSFGIANLWYSSVISGYREKIEELSVELAKVQKEMELKKEERPASPSKNASK